jgi:DNA-binding GntR family transcriptional regulator
MVSVARSRDPFGTVLAALRRRIADGAYAPGQSLTIVDLAREFGFSTTPMREALAWLAGEGVISERRGSGYSCWRVEPGQLLDLYDLQESYLLFALRRVDLQAAKVRRQSEPAQSPPDGEDEDLRLVRLGEQVLTNLVAASNHSPVIQAHASLTTRLGNVRRAEIHVLTDLRDELEDFSAGFPSPQSQEDFIRRFHERRRGMSAEIHRNLVSGRIYSKTRNIY